MGRFLKCSDRHHQDSDHSFSSPSTSSLYSESTLPYLPSLTPHYDQTTEYDADAAIHYKCSATLKGHSSYISSIAIDGVYLYTGASDGEIRIWERNSRNGSVIAEGYSGVKSIVVSSDKLFTAHHDHKIRLWKIDNPTVSGQKYRLLRTLPTVNDRCMRLFSAENYVRVRRHKMRTWVHHVDTVSAVALSGDGSLLYSVSWDRSLKVWRTSDFKCVESVQGAHDDAINAVVLSIDGLVFTASADKTVRVWEKRDGEKKKKKKHVLVFTLEKHKSGVNALALSSDGSVLYSGASDRSIIVWERDGGGGGGGLMAAGKLRGHKKSVLCLDVVGVLLFSGSADNTVRVWKWSGISYSCLAVMEGHSSPVKCLSVALHNGRECEKNDSGQFYVVYSGGLDLEIKVWQIWVPFLVILDKVSYNHSIR